MLEPRCRFERTPLSGGWGKSSGARKDFRTAGDLVTSAKHWPFCVEVKWRERWVLSRLLKGVDSPVWQWWSEANDHAIEQGDQPMLWFKKNREPWRVLVRFDFAAHRRFPPPDRVWSSRELFDVGVGIRFPMPVMYEATVLLDVEPNRLITRTRSPCKGWRKA